MKASKALSNAEKEPRHQLVARPEETTRGTGAQVLHMHQGTCKQKGASNPIVTTSPTEAETCRSFI